MGEVVSGHEFPTDISQYYVEPLHNKPFLLTACSELINLEWKRSLEARKRSIEGSCENFPMSLLVLLKNSDPPKVVGHCKITRIPFSDNKVFIQTVVIHPKLRGKGFGTFLMEHVEEVAKKKKISTIYLTTDGQEGFYRKLGYNECSPLSMYGTEETDEVITQRKPLKSLNSNNYIQSSGPSVPPPPPLPAQSQNKSLIITKNTKTFMKKKITMQTCT